MSSFSQLWLWIISAVASWHCTQTVLSVKVRKYVRNDGKTIELFPMAHIADAGFYQKVSQTFPTNSIILMEGVTDENNLLTNKITYKRMAKTLGLAEQHEKFKPTRGEMVMADVDVDQFSHDTIDLLNLAMLVHARGLTPGNVQKLMEYRRQTILRKSSLMISSRNAISISWKKSSPSCHRRTTSWFRGEWPTCRGLQTKFKSLDSGWMQPMNIW